MFLPQAWNAQLTLKYGTSNTSFKLLEGLYLPELDDSFYANIC